MYSLCVIFSLKRTLVRAFDTRQWKPYLKMIFNPDRKRNNTHKAGMKHLEMKSMQWKLSWKGSNGVIFLSPNLMKRSLSRKHQLHTISFNMYFDSYLGNTARMSWNLSIPFFAFLSCKFRVGISKRMVRKPLSMPQIWCRPRWNLRDASVML